MKKLLTASVLISVACASRASFELVMAVEYAGSASAGRVHRFDGDTGADLGWFGGSELRAPLSISINQSLGRAYVYTYGGQIWTYNYNTGAYINNFSAGSTGLGTVSVASDGNLLVGSSTSLRKINANTGSTMVTYKMYPFEAPYVTGMGADGNVYVVDSNSSGLNWLLQYNPAGGEYVNYYGPDPLLKSVVGQIASVGNSIACAVGTTKRLMMWDMSLNRTLNLDLSATLGTEVDGVAYGHGARMYVSGLNASGGSIVRYNRSSGEIVPFVSSTSYNYVSLATVVAPEPTSIAGLGLAVLLLGRRRRTTR